tara:strand:- start:56 stop:739 length:684 start_codon:yes stop_codon:yes gene_type:complete
MQKNFYHENKESSPEYLNTYIQDIEDKIINTPLSPFHICLDLEFTNSPTSIKDTLINYIKTHKLKTLFVMINGFSANPQNEFYYELSGSVNEWERDFDFANADVMTYDEFKLTGMDEIATLFEVYNEARVYKFTYSKYSEQRQQSRLEKIQKWFPNHMTIFEEFCQDKNGFYFNNSNIISSVVTNLINAKFFRLLKYSIEQINNQTIPIIANDFDNCETPIEFYPKQ